MSKPQSGICIHSDYPARAASWHFYEYILQHKCPLVVSKTMTITSHPGRATCNRWNRKFGKAQHTAMAFSLDWCGCRGGEFKNVMHALLQCCGHWKPQRDVLCSPAPVEALWWFWDQSVVMILNKCRVLDATGGPPVVSNLIHFGRWRWKQMPINL